MEGGGIVDGVRGDFFIVAELVGVGVVSMLLWSGLSRLWRLMFLSRLVLIERFVGLKIVVSRRIAIAEVISARGSIQIFAEQRAVGNERRNRV